MNLKARKYEFIQKLMVVNEPLFEKLEAILNQELDSSKRVSIEQYNIEIKEAVLDIEDGNYYTQEEVREIASKWGR